MTLTGRPETPGSGDVRTAQKGTSCETHQSSQDSDQPTAEDVSSSYVRVDAKNADSAAPDGLQNGSGDTPSLPSLKDKSTQQSKGTGIMGIFTGVVGMIMPRDGEKRRQKGKSSALEERQPATASEAQEPTDKAQAKHEPSIPQESAQKLRNEEKREADTLRQSNIMLRERVRRYTTKLQEATTHAEDMEQVVRRLRENLEAANSKVAALRKTVAENEAIITQSHAAAVKTLAGNVSRSVTDDTIREDLKKFFQNDFFSWCADLCTDRIQDENFVLAKLLHAGIINASSSHWAGPEHLRFQMNSPDGSGPLVLLQAALAQRLCDLYMTDAYFLAEALPFNVAGRSCLSQFEHHLSQVNPDAVPGWRIQTMDCLETAVPITVDYAQQAADKFVQEYWFLLSVDKYDYEAMRDLAQIFADFASLARKLWKSGAKVRWYSTRDFGEIPFELGNAWSEVESPLVSALGQLLNGRPIGLIIRPLILSSIISENGNWEPVIWHKALAWVSGEEDPMDQMDLI